MNKVENNYRPADRFYIFFLHVSLFVVRYLTKKKKKERKKRKRFRRSFAYICIYKSVQDAGYSEYENNFKKPFCFKF